MFESHAAFQASMQSVRCVVFIRTCSYHTAVTKAKSRKTPAWTQLSLMEEENETESTGQRVVCICVCVSVYDCALDGFNVGRAEQMGPCYQRVQQNRTQQSVI